MSMRSDASMDNLINFKSDDTRFNLKYYILFVKDMILVRYFKSNSHNCTAL